MRRGLLFLQNEFRGAGRPVREVFRVDRICTARLALSALTIYRGLWRDGVFAAYARLLEAARGAEMRAADARVFLDAYGSFYAALGASPDAWRDSGGAPSFPEHVEALLRGDDNPFSRAAAANRAAGALLGAAENDFALLSRALLPAEEIKAAACEAFGEEDAELRGLLLDLPEWEHVPPRLDAEAAARFYAEHGCGIFARYGALRWRGGALHGVASPDPVRFCDLKGYEYERGAVADNTLRFLEGSAANNILLYGDRGTGKSSTVKAVANEYRARGLRIIEVPKKAIAEFPALVRLLEGVPLRFILFIDDLSFERDDDSYAALKGVLEGGLAARPRNVVIYATSNRRHFVRERFSEREGDDIHAADAMQETLSLADRFGITVTFSAPDQAHYLAIVRALMSGAEPAQADGEPPRAGRGAAGGDMLPDLTRAADASAEAGAGPAIPWDELERGALQWALLYNGRSPRTARQYVDWAQARLRAHLPLTP